MEVEKIKKYVGKKCLLILKNGFEFTAIVPAFDGTCFTIIDKFGKSVELECDLISGIMERNY